MAKRDINDLEQNGLERAVELMAIAAKNSFNFRGKNTAKIMSVGNEEMEEMVGLRRKSQR